MRFWNWWDLYPEDDLYRYTMSMDTAYDPKLEGRLDPIFSFPDCRECGYSFAKTNTIGHACPGRKSVDPNLPEPMPKGTGREIVPLLIAEIEARAKQGEQTYGERLKAFNGRSAVRDALEEALDLAVYLRQVLEEERSPDEAIQRAYDRGWVAGVLDGEGCLSVTVNKEGSVQASLVVINSDREMLEKLSRVTGVGTIYDKGTQKGARFPVYHWYLSLHDAASLLRSILTQLTTKKIEAELFLSLYDLRQERRGIRTTKEEQDLAKRIQRQKRVRGGKLYRKRASG